MPLGWTFEERMTELLFTYTENMKTLHNPYPECGGIQPANFIHSLHLKGSMLAANHWVNINVTHTQTFFKTVFYTYFIHKVN